jgi:ActR/RegA family two-component response regulator/anti-sigma regulatory factor (Ser/Thr protein kinase)
VNANEAQSVLEAIVSSQRNADRASRLDAELARRPGIRVIEHVRSISDAMSAARRRQPQLVIFDLEVDLGADYAVIKDIRRVVPDARVVVHVETADAEDVPGKQSWLTHAVDAALDPRQRAGLSARLTLPDQPLSVQVARSFVGELLAQWELESYLEPLRLVTSELVANSVLHVRRSCAVELTCEDDVLRIAVADADPGVPKVQEVDAASERGRGLHLVSAFSSAWGVESLAEGGKVVWAELDAVPSGMS